MSYHSRTLVLASQAPVIGATVVVGNDSLIVEGLGKIFRISDDMPSTHGSHLLGHEGSWARYAYLRPASAPVAAPIVSSARAPKAGEARGAFSTTVPAPSADLLRQMQMIMRDYLGVSEPKAKSNSPTLIEMASTIRYSGRSGRMSLAWVVAKRVSTLLGGAPRHYVGAALRAIAAFHRNAGQPVDRIVEAVRAAWHQA